MHYATHHQMQCTIELRTLSFISVPNLVSLAQNFLEPEDPSRIKLFGPGAFTLHPTRTATGKAYRLGQYTCDLQVWDRWCTSSCLQWRQKQKRYKTVARALHVHSALQPTPPQWQPPRLFPAISLPCHQLAMMNSEYHRSREVLIC